MPLILDVLYILLHYLFSFYFILSILCLPIIVFPSSIIIYAKHLMEALKTIFTKFFFS